MVKDRSTPPTPQENSLPQKSTIKPFLSNLIVINISIFYNFQTYLLGIKRDLRHPFHKKNRM